MIGKIFEFNWFSISRTTSDYQIWLDVVDWKRIDISDEQTNVQGFHGIKVSPTFARWRRVTIEWVILSDTKEGSSKAMDFLENLFALQWIPSQTDFKPFIVTDEQDRRWELLAKIKEPVDFEISDDDWRIWANRRFRVVLQAEDPRYFSTETQEVIGVESFFGWVKFPVKFWVKFNENFNEIQVNSEWNTEAPLEIILTAKWNIDTPLKIKNLSNNTFFWLDIDAVDGDIIVINSKTKTATKNGANILANRITWSTWPQAKGTTLFSIYDKDWWLYDSDFDVKIKFKNVLL